MFKYVFLVSLLSLQSFTAISQQQSSEQLPIKALLGEYIKWAEETDKKGLKIGEPLTQSGLELAIDIGIQHPERVRIIYLESVPFPYENKALTALGENLGLIGNGITNNAQVFGYSIYVRHGYELDRPKLAHELVHVLQIERSSLGSVVMQHIQDMSKYDYENAPLEVEAFKANLKYK